MADNDNITTGISSQPDTQFFLQTGTRPNGERWGQTDQGWQKIDNVTTEPGGKQLGQVNGKWYVIPTNPADLTRAYFASQQRMGVTPHEAMRKWQQKENIREFQEQQKANPQETPTYLSRVQQAVTGLPNLRTAFPYAVEQWAKNPLQLGGEEIKQLATGRMGPLALLRDPWGAAESIIAAPQIKADLMAGRWGALAGDLTGAGINLALTFRGTGAADVGPITKGVLEKMGGAAESATGKRMFSVEDLMNEGGMGFKGEARKAVANIEDYISSLPSKGMQGVEEYKLNQLKKGPLGEVLNAGSGAEVNQALTSDASATKQMIDALKEHGFNASDGNSWVKGAKLARYAGVGKYGWRVWGGYVLGGGVARMFGLSYYLGALGAGLGVFPVGLRLKLAWELSDHPFAAEGLKLLDEVKPGGFRMPPGTITLPPAPTSKPPGPESVIGGGKGGTYNPLGPAPTSGTAGPSPFDAGQGFTPTGTGLAAPAPEVTPVHLTPESWANQILNWERTGKIQGVNPETVTRPPEGWGPSATGPSSPFNPNPGPPGPAGPWTTPRIERTPFGRRVPEAEPAAPPPPAPKFTPSERMQAGKAAAGRTEPAPSPAKAARPSAVWQNQPPLIPGEKVAGDVLLGVVQHLPGDQQLGAVKSFLEDADDAVAQAKRGRAKGRMGKQGRFNKRWLPSIYGGQ
jgi:hypothetical protein